MKRHNEMLFELARSAILNLFSDTSVSIEETRYNLQALIDELQVMLESISEEQ